MKDYFAEEIEPKKDYFAEEILSAKPDYFAEEILNVTPQKTPIQEQPFSMFKETMRNLPSAIGQTLTQAPIQTLTDTARMINEPLEAGKLGAIKGAYDTISGLVKFSREQFKDIAKPYTQEQYDAMTVIPAVDEFVSNLSQKAKQKFLQSDY